MVSAVGLMTAALLLMTAALLPLNLSNADITCHHNQTSKNGVVQVCVSLLPYHPPLLTPTSNA